MTTDVASPGPPVRRGWSAWRTILVILGALVALLGGAMLVAGAVGLWAHQQHDSDGYLTTDTKQFSTDTFALSAPSLDVDVAGPDALYAEDLLGDVRIRGESSKAGTPLFIGIGPADAVAKYLEGVGHAEISDVDVDPFNVTYTPRPGAAPTALPADQSFWVASETGTGPRTLVWNVADGNWSVLIMNADGSAGVSADLNVGATLPVVQYVAIGALVAGGLLLIIGLAVIVVTIATRGRTMAATAPGQNAPPR
jgi:hypothetical protein